MGGGLCFDDRLCDPDDPSDVARGFPDLFGFAERSDAFGDFYRDAVCDLARVCDDPGFGDRDRVTGL